MNLLVFDLALSCVAAFIGGSKPTSESQSRPTSGFQSPEVIASSFETKCRGCPLPRWAHSHCLSFAPVQLRNKRDAADVFRRQKGSSCGLSPQAFLAYICRVVDLL